MIAKVAVGDVLVNIPLLQVFFSLAHHRHPVEPCSQLAIRYAYAPPPKFLCLQLAEL